MSFGGDEITVSSKPSTGQDAVGVARFLRSTIAAFRADPQFAQLTATVLTTLVIFGVFLIQGIIVARILGPAGRGEFGTALFFPRDILLYAGLLGAIEVVTGLAARSAGNVQHLRFAAARLGLLTGCLTASVAAVLSVSLLLLTDKAYLIPFCLLCCLFVPWEHMQLTVSAVDRGSGNFWRYNICRFLLAVSFPLLALAAWLLEMDQLTGLSWLWLMCGLMVFGKFIGLLPTLRGMDWLGIRRVKSAESAYGDAAMIKIPSVRKLLRQGRPYAFNTLVTECFERLDIFLFLALADVTRSGYYFVAVPAAALLIIAPNALGVFTFNAGARNDLIVTRKLAAKVLGLTAVFQLFATIILALLIDPLIRLFYGAEFSDAVPFALWLLPASAIKGFLQAAEGYLKGRHKPMIGVWSRLLSIAVMLGAVAVAYPSWGLICIPMAACLSQFISLLIIVPAIFIDIDRQQAARAAGGHA